MGAAESGFNNATDGGINLVAQTPTSFLDVTPFSLTQSGLITPTIHNVAVENREFVTQALDQRQLDATFDSIFGAQDAFNRGVQRGATSFNNGHRNREKVGIDLLDGVNVNENIAIAERNRIIAEAQKQQNIETFTDQALTASYLIPGAGLVRLGAAAVKFGAQQLLKQTAKSTIIGATSLAAGVETIRGGAGVIGDSVTGLVTGLDPYQSTYDAVAEASGFFNTITAAGGDFRGGLALEFRGAGGKIGEIKGISGTDLDFGLSGKLEALKAGLPGNQTINQSVRLDFNNSLVPSINLIHEHDFNSLGIKTDSFEFKSVARQNLSSEGSVPRVGFNSKLSLNSYNLLGLNITPSIVFEGRY